MVHLTTPLTVSSSEIAESCNSNSSGDEKLHRGHIVRTLVLFELGGGRWRFIELISAGHLKTPSHRYPLVYAEILLDLISSRNRSRSQTGYAGPNNYHQGSSGRRISRSPNCRSLHSPVYGYGSDTTNLLGRRASTRVLVKHAVRLDNLNIPPDSEILEPSPVKNPVRTFWIDINLRLGNVMHRALSV